MNINRTLLTAILPFAVALAATSADAAGKTMLMSGVTCQAATGTQGTCLDGSVFGVNNVCATDVAVDCPIVAPFETGAATTVGSFGINAFDRSSSSDVSCDVQKLASDGSVLYTKNLKTSGNSLPLQSQSFTPTPLSTLVSGTWKMRCIIPGVTGSGVSHVSTYSFATVN